MKHFLSSITPLFLFIACLVLPEHLYANTADPVATVVAVRGNVVAVNAKGESRTLAIKDILAQEDTVSTDKRSRVQILFRDSTIISLGRKTEMKIAEYEWNQEKKLGALKTKVTEGTFRIMGGAITRFTPEKFSTETPTATIGIRGSMYAGTVTPTSLSVLFQGGKGIDITNPFGTVAITKPGFGTHVQSPNQPPLPPVKFSGDDLALINNELNGEIGAPDDDQQDQEDQKETPPSQDQTGDNKEEDNQQPKADDDQPPPSDEGDKAPDQGDNTGPGNDSQPDSDGDQPPSQDGSEPPPPEGDQSSQDGTKPSTGNDQPPPDGQMPPEGGMPVGEGQMPPKSDDMQPHPDGQMVMTADGQMVFIPEGTPPPEGSIVQPDGEMYATPEGQMMFVPDGTPPPEGANIIPEGMEPPDGQIVALSDGQLMFIPDGMEPPPGSAPPPDGTNPGDQIVLMPEGMMPTKDGSMPPPPDGMMAYPDGTQPPPPDGQMMAYPDGTKPPPPDGQIIAYPDGTMPPPPDGQMMAYPEGTMPPSPDGQMMAYPDGTMPPSPDGQMMAYPDGTMPPSPDGQMMAYPDGTMPPSPDGNQVFIPEGGMPPPPEGNYVFLPEGDMAFMPEGDMLAMAGQPMYDSGGVVPPGGEAYPDGSVPPPGGFYNDGSMPQPTDGTKPPPPDGQMMAYPDGTMPPPPDGSDPYMYDPMMADGMYYDPMMDPMMADGMYYDPKVSPDGMMPPPGGYDNFAYDPMFYDPMAFDPGFIPPDTVDFYNPSDFFDPSDLLNGDPNVIPTSMPTDGLNEFIGTFNGIDDSGSLAGNLFMEVNWRSGKAFGLLQETTYGPGPPAFFYGDVSGTSLTNIRVIGSSDGLSTMKGLGSGDFRGANYELFNFSTIGTDYNISTYPSTSTGTWDVSATTQRIIEDPLDHTVPGGTNDWKGFAVGISENVNAINIERKLMWNTNDSNFDVTLDRDAGTLDGELIVDEIGGSSQFSLKVGAGNGSAYILEDAVIAELGCFSTCIDDGGGAGDLNPEGNYLISEDPMKQTSQYMTWGYWELSHHEPDGGDPGGLEDMYHTHVPYSMWISGKETPASYVSGLIGTSITATYKGFAKASKVYSGGMVTNLDGTVDLVFTFTGTPTLSGHIALPGQTLNLTTTSVSSTGFSAGGFSEGSGALNGNFYGSQINSVGGNFNATVSTDKYLGIFGANIDSTSAALPPP